MKAIFIAVVFVLVAAAAAQAGDYVMLGADHVTLGTDYVTFGEVSGARPGKKKLLLFF
jgi:hypothetical protein